MKKDKKDLIAVYGTLRQGCGNHNYFLSEATFKGEFLSQPEYSMFSLGGFPGLKKDGNTSIVMEVYEVDEEESRAVDGLEGYAPGRPPHFYDKQLIETPWGTAGVYIYVRNTEGLELIESGDWLNRKKEVTYGRESV